MNTPQQAIPKAVVSADWETQYALKIGKGRIVLFSFVYLGWLCFLGYLAAMRWLGALN